MKEIRLLELVLENFRCHAFLRLDFGGGNATLSGGNGVGKTSVRDAFVWLLRGGEAGEVMPPDAGGRREPGRVTAVECTLLVGGRFLGLRRSCGLARPGEVVFGYAVDGVSCGERYFTRQVEALADAETFRVLSDVSYFARELDQKRRRELLSRAAGLPEDREWMEVQPEFAEIPEQMGDKTRSEYHRQLMIRAKEQTRLGNELSERIRECENTLRQVEGLDFAAAEARLAELKRQRDRIGQAGMDRARWESLAARRDSLLRETGRYREALEAVEKQRGALKERVFRGDVCATCGQKLPPDQRGAALQRFRREVRQEARALDSREERLRREALRAKEALESLEGELARKRPMEEPPCRLEEEMEALQRIVDRKKVRDYAQLRLEALQAQAALAASRLEECNRRLALLDRFLRFRERRLEERVNALFEGVEFRLAGEAACDITVAGVPYLRASRGEQLRAGMEIIRVLGEALGVRLPVFLDNAEGITTLPETPGQRIALRTAPGAMKLEREEEKEWEADPTARSM